jgi:hypothetical protein
MVLMLKDNQNVFMMNMVPTNENGRTREDPVAN